MFFETDGGEAGPERISQEQQRSEAERAERIVHARTLSERSEFVRASIRCERALLNACDEDRATVLSRPYRTT